MRSPITFFALLALAACGGAGQPPGVDGGPDAGGQLFVRELATFAESCDAPGHVACGVARRPATMTRWVLECRAGSWEWAGDLCPTGCEVTSSGPACCGSHWGGFIGSVEPGSSCAWSAGAESIRPACARDSAGEWVGVAECDRGTWRLAESCAGGCGYGCDGAAACEP